MSSSPSIVREIGIADGLGGSNGKHKRGDKCVQIGKEKFRDYF